MEDTEVLSMNDRESLWNRSKDIVYGATTILSKKYFLRESNPYIVFFLSKVYC